MALPIKPTPKLNVKESEQFLKNGSKRKQKGRAYSNT